MKTTLEALKELDREWSPGNVNRGKGHFGSLCKLYRVTTDGVYHCLSDECPLSRKWGRSCDMSGTKYSRWSKEVYKSGIYERTKESEKIADSIYAAVFGLVCEEEARIQLEEDRKTKEEVYKRVNALFENEIQEREKLFTELKNRFFGEMFELMHEIIDHGEDEKQANLYALYPEVQSRLHAIVDKWKETL